MKSILQNKILYLIIGVILIVIIFLGIYCYARYVNIQVSPPANQSLQTPSPVTQSPVPTPAISQGIYGLVILKTGNCMPGPGQQEPCNGISKYVARNIYIREPVSSSKNMQGTLLKIKTNLIKQTKSDANGFYQMELPAGTYSIFVEDDDGETCWGPITGEKYCQITISANKKKEFNIVIDHIAY